MSTTYRIETDKGTYDVEVDDAPQADQTSAPPEVSMAQQARLTGMMAQEAFRMTPMGKFAEHPVKNTMENLPMIGAVGGGAVGSAVPFVGTGLGASAGAGLGQIGKRMYDISQGAQGPSEPNFSPKEALMPMAQTAIAGFPEVGGVKAAVQKTAQGLAAKGVGLKGSILKRIGLDKARQVGQTMMDEGVIKPLSGTEATLGRAKDVAAKSGEAIGEGLAAFDEAGVKSFNARKLALKVYKDIRPEYSGGAYNSLHDSSREVANTILAHSEGSGKITFDSAQTLKETLGEMGNFKNVNPSPKEKMYRKAFHSVKTAIEGAMENAAGTEVVTEGGPSIVGTDLLPKDDKVVGEVSTISPDVLQRYQHGKKVYGAAETATEGLTGRLNAEASSGPSLRGTIIAAGAASQGHLTPALEALGLWEVGSRYGARAGASSLNFVNNNAIAENVRRAVMSHFISRIRMKGEQPQ